MSADGVLVLLMIHWVIKAAGSDMHCSKINELYRKDANFVSTDQSVLYVL